MQVSKRILIVDSDPNIHALLDVMLRSGDRLILSAHTGIEALNLLQTKTFDLVLADLDTPAVNGLAFIEQLRIHQPQAALIIMTAQNTPAAVIDSIASQAFGHIGKPFTADAMTDLVGTALHSDMAIDDIVVLSGKPSWITLKISCKIKVAERLTNFFREILGDMPPDHRDTISCAFRELLMNAIEHGGKSDPSQFVHLTFIRTTRSLIYMVRDPGDGFSFDSLSHAAINNADDAPFNHVKVRSEMGIRPGGFGILMTKNFADELLYSAKGNEVMFIKYLDN